MSAMDVENSPNSDRMSSTSSSQPPETQQEDGTMSDFRFAIEGDDGSSQTLSSDEMENYDSCPHLAHLFLDPELRKSYERKYRAMIAWSVKMRRGGSSSEEPPTKKQKFQPSECDKCRNTLHRPVICLRCNFAGCWKEGHIQAHVKLPEHTFCVDVQTGNVFCAECDDFIHHSGLESVFDHTVLRLEEKSTVFRESKSKSKRTRFEPWKPSDEDKKALQKNKNVGCQARRGLLNLGSTCYLNVILQTFIHNPLMRNYFLSDKHPHKLCMKRDDMCLCCEMDRLFTEIYTGAQPYGPISFLHAMWRNSSEINGDQQQDAHEFFIAILNQIHAFSRGSTKTSCLCVVHLTFAGQLQSDVQCKACGNITTQVDLVFDISLDLGQKALNAQEPMTLASCLRRYTQAENLESRCDGCNSTANEATKKLSIRKLPPVLCFTFKRFKHDATATKIDTHVKFPASIDMTPYTSLSTTSSSDPSKIGPSGLYQYDLFAVVNHEGKVDRGHYTNFARFENEWYRFDDEKVFPASLHECLASNAYMILYVKRHLNYKQHLTPTYILTAAEKERLKLEEARGKE